MRVLGNKSNIVGLPAEWKQHITLHWHILVLAVNRSLDEVAGGHPVIDRSTRDPTPALSPRSSIYTPSAQL